MHNRNHRHHQASDQAEVLEQHQDQEQGQAPSWTSFRLLHPWQPSPVPWQRPQHSLLPPYPWEAAQLLEELYRAEAGCLPRQAQTVQSLQEAAGFPRQS